jgi:hypothetical protein
MLHVLSLPLKTTCNTLLGKIFGNHFPYFFFSYISEANSEVLKVEKPINESIVRRRQRYRISQQNLPVFYYKPLKTGTII